MSEMIKARIENLILKLAMLYLENSTSDKPIPLTDADRNIIQALWQHDVGQDALDKVHVWLKRKEKEDRI